MFGKKKNDNIVLLGNIFSGLGLPQNTDIMATYNSEGLTFMTTDKRTYNLNMDKITDIIQYDETSIEKIVNQSAPGMILGAATFGVLGAMVGGRVKTKEEKTTKMYLLIKYSDDEILILTKDYWNAKKIQDTFKKDHTVQVTEL